LSMKLGAENGATQDTGQAIDVDRRHNNITFDNPQNQNQPT